MIAPPSINFPCGECSNVETTTFTTDPWEPHFGDAPVVWDYTCISCNKRRVSFWVKWTSPSKKKYQAFGKTIEGYESVMLVKAGQWPAWSIPISKKLKSALGDDNELYKKGLGNISVGWGIGASAYLRRVIENKVNAILDVAESAARLEGDQKALDNIKDARSQNRASDRLKVAAQHLPAMLRPGGVNPLALIYGNLSGPLHSETEEESLEVANTLVDSIRFLFESLEDRMAEAKKFAADMEKMKQRAAAKKVPEDT